MGYVLFIVASLVPSIMSGTQISRTQFLNVFGEENLEGYILNY